MQLLNNWVQCLNCGNEYSVDTTLYMDEAVKCPMCKSEEHTELPPEQNYLQGDLIKLNESLMKDGEWD